MSYDFNGLVCIENFLGAVGGAPKRMYSYVTNDTKATLEGAGYFDDASEILNVGDVIVASGDLDGTPFLAMYVVSSNSGGVVGITYADLGVLATAAEINRVADVSTRLVAAGGTLSATVNAHDGKTILLDTAAGSVVTLPAATGSGAIIKCLVSVTATSNSHIVKVADNDDLITGFMDILDLDAAALSAYKANGTDHDTITMNRTTTGGVIGDYVELQDVAANRWTITRGKLTCVAGSNPATPFSATV